MESVEPLDIAVKIDPRARAANRPFVLVYLWGLVVTIVLIALVDVWVYATSGVNPGNIAGSVFAGVVEFCLLYLLVSARSISRRPAIVQIHLDDQALQLSYENGQSERIPWAQDRAAFTISFPERRGFTDIADTRVDFKGQLWTWVTREQGNSLVENARGRGFDVRSRAEYVKHLGQSEIYKVRPTV